MPLYSGLVVDDELKTLSKVRFPLRASGAGAKGGGAGAKVGGAAEGY